MKWREVSLGDFIENNCLDIQTGPFGTQLKASDYTIDGTPVINVRNIGYGELRSEKLEHVPDSVTTRLFKHILLPNDIVLARKGAVDRHLLVEDTHAGWMQGSDCIRLRIQTDEINPIFLSFALRLETHKQWILTQCSNKATMPSLNQDVISRLTICLPDPDIQERIVFVLKKYDDLIENNQRRMELLEQSARLLYKEWFVNLRFPGHEHVEVVDGVPLGWQFKRLVDIANLLMGQSPKSEYYNMNSEGLPFHQGVTNYGVRFVNHEVYCTIKKRVAQPDDILCSVRAPVGRLNFTLDEIVIGRGLAAINSKFGYQSFLYYQLKNHFFKEDMIGGGAIFASVTKKDLENQELLCPPPHIVNDFEDCSKPIDIQIKNLHLQNIKLREARDILLPKLMIREVIV